MTVSRSTCTSPKGRHLKLNILQHDEMSASARRLVLEAPEITRGCIPGQFVHVLCGNSYDPLLRRPLSIHDADPESGKMTLLYEIRGRGTSLLADKSVGESLDVLGPLGTGFALPKSVEQPLLLIAGGIAVAPLHFLAKHLFKRFGGERMTFMIGARTENMLLCVDRFSDLGTEVRISTDDGSAGIRGFVTELAREYVDRIDKSNPPIVYACGPMPMLKVVAGISKAHGLSCQVSTEAKMACGVGACMSCVGASVRQCVSASVRR